MCVSVWSPKWNNLNRGVYPPLRDRRVLCGGFNCSLLQQLSLLHLLCVWSPSMMALLCKVRLKGGSKANLKSSTAHTGNNNQCCVQYFSDCYRRWSVLFAKMRNDILKIFYNKENKVEMDALDQTGSILSLFTTSLSKAMMLKLMLNSMVVTYKTTYKLRKPNLFCCVWVPCTYKWNWRYMQREAHIISLWTLILKRSSSNVHLAFVLHFDPNKIINNFMGLFISVVSNLYCIHGVSCCVVFVDLAEVTPCKWQPNKTHEGAIWMIGAWLLVQHLKTRVRGNVCSVRTSCGEYEWGAADSRAGAPRLTKGIMHSSCVWKPRNIQTCFMCIHADPSWTDSLRGKLI